MTPKPSTASISTVLALVAEQMRAEWPSTRDAKPSLWEKAGKRRLYLNWDTDFAPTYIDVSSAENARESLPLPTSYRPAYRTRAEMVRDAVLAWIDGGMVPDHPAVAPSRRPVDLEGEAARTNAELREGAAYRMATYGTEWWDV